jgi:Tol biopolymer transport system component/DNA-binding winged helix-turn-helix (wHTH) protein
MSRPEKRLYEFGEFVFDPSERTLRQDADQIQLSPKVSETLMALIQKAGRTMSHEELIKRVWADTFASKNNLDQNIFQLRKLLGDSSSEPRYIKTVPRLGYQFLSTVRELPAQRVVAVAKDAPEDLEAQESLAAAGIEQGAEPKPVRRLNSKTKVWIFTLVLLIAAGPLVFVVHKLSTRVRNLLHANETKRVWKLQADGIGGGAVLSPSGELVAYVRKGEGSEIWIADSDGPSRHSVTADTANLSNLVFSGDGRHIYYIRDAEEEALYVVPAEGGTPMKILANVGGRISLSPDGKQFAFIRYYVSEGGSSLFIANADGTQERRVATHKEPTYFSPMNGPAWSPDGKLIVVMEEGSGSNYSTLTAFDLVTGTERRINTLSEWPYLRDVAWLPDGSGLVLIVTEGGPTATTQIWRLSYPGFEAKQLASGPDFYESLSLDRTSNRMLVNGRQTVSDIWVMADGDNPEPRKITEGGSAGRVGVCWMPDGRLVYHSREAGVDGLWMMDANGSRRLLTEGSSGTFYPSVTADGRHLIFMSKRSGGLHVWRMDLESGALTQLTDGSEELWPQVSADGKWVYYNSNASVWKVSVNGGAQLQVISESSYHPKPSPDGTLLAYANIMDAPGASRRKVVSAHGGPAKYSFDGPLVRLGPVNWSKDGRSLLYTDQRGGVSNIYSQPLDGGEPKQLTHFTEGVIYFFDQSWDGKRLAVARGNVSRTIQLFSGYN